MPSSDYRTLLRNLHRAVDYYADAAHPTGDRLIAARSRWSTEVMPAMAAARDALNASARIGAMRATRRGLVMRQIVDPARPNVIRYEKVSPGYRKVRP